MSRRLSFSPSLIAFALLLIYACLQLSSLAVTSITLDEPSHLAAGYAFLTRGDTPVGACVLRLGLYNPATTRRISLTSVAHSVSSVDYVVLGTIQVTH
jgi:hypothetical protein